MQALDTQATVELLNPPFPNPSQNASTRWRYSLEIKGGARIRPYICRLSLDKLVRFEGLTINTTYTVRAYSFIETFESDACQEATELDALDFTTTGTQEDPYLTVEGVTATEATIFISNWQAGWQLRGRQARVIIFTGPDIPDGNTQITLTSLTPGTLYDLGAFQLSNNPLGGERITPNVQFTTLGIAPVPKLRVVSNTNISPTSSTVVMAIANAPLATIGIGAGNILWYYTITSGTSTSTLTCNRKGTATNVTFEDLTPGAKYTVRGYRQGQELSDSCSNSNNEFDVLEFTAAAATVLPTLTLVGTATTTSQRVRINNWRNAWQVRTIDQNNDGRAFSLVRAGINEYLIENLKPNTRYTATAYGSTTTATALTGSVSFTTKQTTLPTGDNLYIAGDPPMPFPNRFRSITTMGNNADIVDRANKSLEFLWWGTNNSGTAGDRFTQAVADAIIRTFVLRGVPVPLRVNYYSILTMYGIEAMYGDVSNEEAGRGRGRIAESYAIEFQSTLYREGSIGLTSTIPYGIVRLLGKLAPGLTYRMIAIDNYKYSIAAEFGALESGETIVGDRTFTVPAVQANDVIKSPYFNSTFGMDITVTQPRSGDRTKPVLNLVTDRGGYGAGIDYYLQSAGNSSSIFGSVDENGIFPSWRLITADQNWTPLENARTNILMPSVVGRYTLWLRRSELTTAFLAVVLDIGSPYRVNAHRPYPWRGNVVRTCVINPIDESP